MLEKSRNVQISGSFVRTQKAKVQQARGIATRPKLPYSSDRRRYETSCQVLIVSLVKCTDISPMYRSTILIAGDEK